MDETHYRLEALDETQPTSLVTLDGAVMQTTANATTVTALQPPKQTNKKLFYRYNSYQKRWEKNPMFKGWLAPVSNANDCAWCKACQKRLTAHKTDLLKHAKSLKHKQKFTAMCMLPSEPQVKFIFNPDSGTLSRMETGKAEGNSDPSDVESDDDNVFQIKKLVGGSVLQKSLHLQYQEHEAQMEILKRQKRHSEKEHDTRMRYLKEKLKVLEEQHGLIKIQKENEHIINAKLQLELANVQATKLNVVIDHGQGQC